MRRIGVDLRAIGTGALLLVVLASCGLFGPQAIYQTTSVSLSVSASSFSGSRAISPTASPENITLLTVTVVGEDKYGVYQNPLATAQMTYSGGLWSATIADLPIGPTLTFSLAAFDAAGTQIYAGSSTRVLSGGETISVALYPFDDGVSIQFPVVLSISRPAEILVSSTVAVTVALQGGTNETLEVSFSGNGGSFSPSSATVPLGGTQGQLQVGYTAPPVPGGSTGYVQTVQVTNEQGNSVQTEFSTVVVYQVAEATIQVDSYAPSTTGLTGRRQGSEVIWTAEVSDDGPPEDLSYQWSYSGGLSFADGGSTNPAVLQGYDESATGTVTLEVTDGEGLSTTVSFLLVAGQFPDVTVVASGPTVSSISPSQGLATASTPNVEIRGAGFTASTVIEIGGVVVPAGSCTLNSTDSITCTIPGSGSGAAFGPRDVIADNGGGLAGTLANGWRYVGVWNESGDASEADYCNIQYPSSVSAIAGAPTTIYGRVYELGITAPPGADPAVSAQVGYGPGGTDPLTEPADWVYADATFSVQVGNDDEYVGLFSAPAPGTYSYVFRFSMDGGETYTYADLDGAGSDPNLEYSSAQLGLMTVAAQ